MATGHQGLACLVLMCIVIAWHSSTFVGWSSIQHPSSRHQSQSRKGITSLAAEGEQQQDPDAEDEPEFLPDQDVVLLGPSKLAGKTGTIVGQTSDDTFAVRLSSGSIFHIKTESIKDANQKSDIFKMLSNVKEAFFRQARRVKKPISKSAKPAASAPVQDTPQISEAAPASATSPEESPGQPVEKNEKDEQAKDQAPRVEPSPRAKELPTEEADELEFIPGQRVVLLGPSKLAGRKGTIVGATSGEDTFAVELDSGSVFHIKSESIKDAQQAASSDILQTMFSNAKQAKQGFMQQAKDLKNAIPFKAPSLPKLKSRKSTKMDGAAKIAPVVEASQSTEQETFEQASLPKPPVAQTQPAEDEEELEFSPGQEVIVVAPAALAGTKGTIEGPAMGDTFAVRLKSGSIFHIPTENIKDAKQTAGLGFLGKLFKGATRVTVTNLGFFPKMFSSLKQTFKQTLGRRASRPSPVAPAVPANAQNEKAPDNNEPDPTPTDTEEPMDVDPEMELEPGQSVMVLGPPAMAGKKGTILSSVPGDKYAVQFETGSVFHIGASDLQILSDGSGGAGGGIGKGGSGRGGDGEGVPPGNFGSGQANPESGGDSSPWWLVVAILAVILAVAAERREHRRHRSRPRIDRLLSWQGGSPASMDPLLAILVMATAVAAVLLTKWVLETFEDLPEILKTVISWFRAAPAAISEVVEQAAEVVVSPNRAPAKVDQGFRLQYLGFLVLLIVVAVSIIAARRRRKAKLGKGSTKKSDLAVIKEGQIEPEAEPEEPHKPHADCPEVTLRVIMLVAKCRLFVAGDCPSTGTWNPENSIVELKTNKLSHPVWTGKWHPRAETSSREFQFKLVLLRPDGQVLWEDVENRKLLVKPREKLSVEITFNRAGMQVNHVGR